MRPFWRLIYCKFRKFAVAVETFLRSHFYIFRSVIILVKYIIGNVKGLNNELPGINMYAFEVENKLEIIK